LFNITLFVDVLGAADGRNWGQAMLSRYRYNYAVVSCLIILFLRCFRSGGRKGLVAGEAKYNYAVVGMFSQDIVTVYTSLLERLW
jgi:hypothetical protein